MTKSMDRDSKGRFYKGFKPWNAGRKLSYAGHAKPHTEESKRKISANRKGKYTGTQNHNFGGLRPGVGKKIARALTGRKLAPEHHNKIKMAALRGPDSPSWKGGSKARSKYLHKKCPSEFASMATKAGLVLVHRLVMARYLGRPLLKTEVVDHINGVTTDNRPENLRLYDNNAAHLAETLSPRNARSEQSRRRTSRTLFKSEYSSVREEGEE